MLVTRVVKPPPDHDFFGISAAKMWVAPTDDKPDNPRHHGSEGQVGFDLSRTGPQVA